MRRGAVAALVAFAVTMACFGILSLAVDANGVARVKAVEPSRQTLASGADRRTCVPLEALHWRGAADCYVLALDEREGFLGPELAVREVSVSVAEQDDEFAALEDGALASQQRVVTRSDKVLSDGDRARESDA